MSGFKQHLRVGFATMALLGWGLGGCAAGVDSDEVASEFSILSLSPKDGATDVGLKAIIEAEFSKEVDSSTLTVGNMSIKEVEGTSGLSLEEEGQGLVTGSIAYEGTSRLASYTPSADLREKTKYQITLATDIKSSSAASLDKEYTSTFTTGSSATTSTGAGGSDVGSGGSTSGGSGGSGSGGSGTGGSGAGDSGSGSGAGGGTTPTATLETVCGNLSAKSGFMVCDSTTCYFILNPTSSTDGRVCSCNLSSGAANCFVQNLCKPTYLSVDSTNFYYALQADCEQPDRIYRCPLTSVNGTCTPSTLFSTNDSPINGVSTNGTYIFFADGISKIRAVQISSGAVNTLCEDDTVGSPLHTSIDSTRVYFPNHVGQGGHATAISSCPLDFSTTTVTDLVTGVSNTIGFDLVSDGSTLFYSTGTNPPTESSLVTDWQLKKISVTGGTSTTIASNLGVKGSGRLPVAVSGSHAYVVSKGSSSDSIYKVKTDGSSVQVLTTIDNAAPLAVVGDYLYIGATHNSVNGVYRIAK